MTVVNPNGFGVFFEFVNGSKVENVSATKNQFGIYLYKSTDNEIEENKVNGNFVLGIYNQIGTGNEVGENTALGNGAFDLIDDTFNCDNNEWEDNTFVPSNQPCIG